MKNSLPRDGGTAEHGTRGAARGRSGITAAQFAVFLLSLLPALVAFGAEVPCSACHAEAAGSFAGTPHGIALDGSCTACHGDGAAHLASPSAATIRTFTAEPAVEQNAVCTACHQEADLAQTNAHSAAGLACSSCHSVHAGKKKH